MALRAGPLLSGIRTVCLARPVASGRQARHLGTGLGELSLSFFQRCCVIRSTLATASASFSSGCKPGSTVRCARLTNSGSARRPTASPSREALATALPSPFARGEQVWSALDDFLVQSARRLSQPSWQGGRVDLLWNSHSEATLWLHGRSAQGLNYEPAAHDRSVRPDALLLAQVRGGETIEFQVEMACNSVFGAEPGFRPLLPPSALRV